MSTPVSSSSSRYGNPSDFTNSPTLAASSTALPTKSANTTSTATNNPLAVTVAQDGSGQFTAINAAILFAQIKSLPTVTIKAGTYTETVVVSATATVTVVGETAASSSSTYDYADNKVTIISNSSSIAALSFGTSASQGITWKNINFDNPSQSSVAGAVSLRGFKQAFYGCQFVTAGTAAITSSYASALIAYSYIEAADKAIYAYPSLYIYESTITVTANNGLLVYNRGATYSTTGVLYNSTVIFDSCSVVQKDGYSNTNVYLAAAGSAGSTVLYRNSSLPAIVAAAGAHNDATTIQTANCYMEFRTTGSGSFANNANARTGLVKLITNPSDLAPYELLAFLENQYPTVATTSTSWIAADILEAIEGSDNTQEAEASSTSTATTATASVSATSASITTTMAATTASPASSTYTVAPAPSAGQYGSVSSAIAALPSDGKAYVIYILAGTYTEQINVNRTGLVTLKGETTYPNDFTQNTVTIQFSNGELTSANSDEMTPIINAKKTDGSGLALYNIDFTNTYPQTANAAALAADFYGMKFAAYGCSFKGYQDTLLANQGVQVFSNCYVEGSVDFIWGYSKAYFHQCYIASNSGSGSAITAQNRPSATWAGGFVFDTCYVTYTSTYGSTYGMTYLGRPWSQYAVVVYMNSYLDKHINSAGWEQWSTGTANTENVTFGEFNNSGPGSWTTTAQRATFATNLTSAEAATYSLGIFIGDTSWLDQTVYNYIPSYNLSVATTSTTTAANSTTTTAVWTHPTSGTAPPAGAVLVSTGASVDDSFANLTAALASLSSDSTTQIIFIYPGYYVEQVPSINRSGPVMIIGYTSTSPGSTYEGNTVSIAYARGLSVSPLPTGHSDAETAVFTTTSSTISMYNVNIVNSDNLDGETASYVTLAASIASTHTGFYGCSFIGWQDTLLTNTKTGYQYYESCYIEGAIDFIWGYSKAYFKGCTIGAKRKNSCVTAQSRASLSAIGGYIFDQCLFTAAANATVDLTQSVYLGRPYSEYAEVVVKNSYLDDIIAPAGWKIWSTSSPNTDYVTFAEYNNSGPGNWQNNSAARQAFQNCTLLGSDKYPLITVMDSTDWIDMTFWDSIVTPQVASGTTTTTAGNTTNSTWMYDGTVPPQGAFVVSKTAIANVTTYDTIQSALNALPASSKETATVFIYPGTYNEQLVLNKSGTTIFLGYSNDTSDYKANTVTITYGHGVDTQADESNSDSATVYAKGNFFQAVNINFANTFGTTKDYASLGFAVASSKYASLYGCQVYGNQDALLINGYFFSYNSYIEGNIDMIWGAGAGYFLASTIAPNEDGINLTADKRLTNTTTAGFVFDKCNVTPADGATFTQISLGRPWNSYARVAYVESNLGSCIEAAGWNQWSSSSPDTDGVLFGEYNNYGAGSSISNRASFSTQLTAVEVEQFELASFFASTSWINMTLVDSTPFSANSTVIVTIPTATPSSSVMSTSTFSSTSAALTTTSYVTVTAYTTTQTTAMGTIATTTTAPDTTTTVVETAIADTTTITPDATTKIVTIKTTTTDSSTLNEPLQVTTETTTVLNNGASTVTPLPITKTLTHEETVLLTSTKTTTVKGETAKVTSTEMSTVTGKAEQASTTTLTVGTTTTITYISTPKSTQVTSTATITVGAGGTTTTTAKATTVTVTTVSTKVKTVKSTTTLSCTTAAKVRRTGVSGLSGPAVAARWAELNGRAQVYITTTSTSTALLIVTTDVKTETVTAAGSKYTTEVEAANTKGKLTTLKPSTVSVTTTSIVAKETTVTLGGSVSTAWTTKVTMKGRTTTLKASTSTFIVTQMQTTTMVVTFTVPSSTLTSVETTTVKTTETPMTAPLSTLTVSENKTVKTTLTTARTTATSIKTITSTLGPSATVALRFTKTTTAKSMTTVTTTLWSTTIKKGAVVCTA